MGIRIGIVGAGTTVAIADRHVEGFLAQEGRCTVAAVFKMQWETNRMFCIARPAPLFMLWAAALPAARLCIFQGEGKQRARGVHRHGNQKDRRVGKASHDGRPCKRAHHIQRGT